MLHITRANRFLFSIMILGAVAARAFGMSEADAEAADVFVEVRSVRHELKQYQPLGLSVTVTNQGDEQIDFEEYPLGGTSRIAGWHPDSYGTLELRIERPDGTELRTQCVFAFGSFCGTVCPIRIKPSDSMNRDFLVAHALDSPVPRESLFAEVGEYLISAIVHRPHGTFESDRVSVRVVAPDSEAERKAVSLVEALSGSSKAALFRSAHHSRWEAWVNQDELSADLPLVEALADPASVLPYREYAQWLLADLEVRELSARIGQCYRDQDRAGVLALVDEAETRLDAIEALSDQSELPELEPYREFILGMATNSIKGIARIAQAIPVPSGSPEAPVAVETDTTVDSIGLYELLPLSVTILNVSDTDIQLQTQPFHGSENSRDGIDVRVSTGWCHLQFVITRPDGQIVRTARTADHGEREHLADVVEPGQSRGYDPVVGVPSSSYAQRGLPVFSEAGQYEIHVIAHLDSIRVQSQTIRITVVDTEADRWSELKTVATLSANGKRVLYSLEAEERRDQLEESDRRLLTLLAQGPSGSAIRAYAQLALSREAGRRSAEAIELAIHREDSGSAREHTDAIESSIRDLRQLVVEPVYREVRGPASALLAELRATVENARESFPGIIPPERQ